MVPVAANAYFVLLNSGDAQRIFKFKIVVIDLVLCLRKFVFTFGK